MKDYLKYTYFFNASHSGCSIEDRHSHSFMMTLYMIKVNKNEFLPFSWVDETMTHYISQYVNKYLNQLEVFREKEPTIENIGDLFFEQLKVILEEKNLVLVQLEMSETPVRVYIVSSCILLPSQYEGDNRRGWEDIISKKQRLIRKKGVDK